MKLKCCFIGCLSPRKWWVTLTSFQGVGILDQHLLVRSSSFRTSGLVAAAEMDIGTSAAAWEPLEILTIIQVRTKKNYSYIIFQGLNYYWYDCWEVITKNSCGSFFPVLPDPLALGTEKLSCPQVALCCPRRKCSRRFNPWTLDWYCQCNSIGSFSKENP